MIIWRTYYTHHPLWVEHAAYGMWANIRFYDVLAGAGYWQALKISLRDGSRYILQPAVLGLAWPRLLWWPHSHILVAGGALYVFLALLTRFVRLRTGSLVLGLGAAVLFCTFVGLYDERNGMGTPWPDYQSLFLVSAAMLSLGLYALSAGVGWLGVAGTCVSLATLARDTGAVYAAVMSLPILALLLLKEFKRGGGVTRVAWLSAWFGIPALPAALLLVSKVSYFQQYYMTSRALQLRQPMGLSAQSIWSLLSAFGGVPTLAGLGMLLAGGLLVRRRRAWATEDILVVYWPVSFFLFLLLNGYTSDQMKEVMYIAPGLVCAAATLGGGMNMQSRLARVLLGSVLGVCLIGAGEGVVTAFTRARYPDANAVALRVSQRAVAEALASVPQRVSWQSYSSYDWGSVVSALTFYEFGHYQPTETWFHNGKNYWDADFPNMDLPGLQEHLFRQAEQDLDVAIVLTHPDQMPPGMEPYSFSLASSVATHIQASSEWRRYRDVNSMAGQLTLYFNRRRQ